MAKKLQDLVLVSEVGSDALILMKQDEGVGLRDLQIRVSDFLSGYLTTALLGTAIGQVPQLIDNGSGTPAFPAVSGEFLTNVTDAVVVGSNLVQGKVFLSDSLVSSNGVSNGTAATPKAVKDMGALKLSLTGGALTGDVSTTSAFIYENGAVTQIRLLDTSLKTIQTYSSGTNTLTVGNIDLNAEITGLDLTFTDVAGTHTVYHTGNAVTIADYEAFATTEQEFNRSREMVSEENAASGIVHSGKHFEDANSVAINEGLWTRENNPNTLFLGKEDGTAGNSKTGLSKVNLAGVISELVGNKSDAQDRFWVKFPDATNGTVTYDSADGSIVDFTTDVDPKYGDVAGTTNEAVARAFEGVVKNGDFRNGTTDWTISGSASLVVTDGIAKITDTSSSTTSQINQTLSLEVGVEYTLEVVVRAGANSTGWIILEGFGNNAVSQNNITSSDWTTVTLTYTPDVSSSVSLVLREGLADGVGHYIEVASVSVRPATNEVVTDRVDMFGLEGFLEEVTNTKPYIYPNGLIQSQAATMNGITTVATNRPASYYAVFDGDTTSSGLGVHFYNLSEADKLLVLGDSNNNLFRLADGRLVQWRIRQRTIAGAGNGDWRAVSTTSDRHALEFRFNGSFVRPQGSQDTAPLMGDGYPLFTSASHDVVRPDDHIDKGAYVAVSANSTRDTSSAVNGECYFLVLGTVSRLNQGAYHPSFNSMGTNYFYDTTTRTWYGNPTDVTSKGQCFTTASPSHGYIGTGSGRPDDRFYDAIYADGKGGVQQDLRLSAQGGTISDILGTEDAKTKNGTQRGLQKLVRTKIFDGNLTVTGTSKNIYITSSGMGLLASSGDTFHVHRSDGSVQTSKVDSVGVDGWVSQDSITNCELVTHVILTYQTNLSVAGEFTQTDLIGDPAKILATPDLANGWLGNWVPVVPNNTGKEFPATRKAVTTGEAVYTTNNGDTWITEPSTHWNWDSNKNSWNISLGASTVAIEQYTAHAYMTEAADNPVVYKGTEGISGEVFALTTHYTLHGSLLAESTIGEVLKSSLSPFNSLYSMQRSYLDYNSGKLYSVSPYDQRHEAIDLPLSDNDSHGCKTLPLVAEENGQLFLYYLSTELIWDTTLDSLGEFSDVDPTAPNNYTAGNWYHFTSGRWAGAWLCKTSLSSATVDASDKTEVNNSILSATGNVLFEAWQGNGWGDDNLITVLDGEGTKTDLNGNTVKVSCHKVPYPLQWVRNTI